MPVLVLVLVLVPVTVQVLVPVPVLVSLLVRMRTLARFESGSAGTCKPGYSHASFCARRCLAEGANAAPQPLWFRVARLQAFFLAGGQGER
jgi:hypothetical protein